MNLLVISTSSDVHLGAEAWERLGFIFFITLLYMSLFLALGLLVSARVQRSAVSLVILLLVWVIFVVFMPSTLVSIAGRSKPPTSALGFSERSAQLEEELEREYYTFLLSSSNKTLTQVLPVAGEYVIKDAAAQERLHEERLKQRISQVRRRVRSPKFHLSPFSSTSLKPLLERGLSGICNF